MRHCLSFVLSALLLPPVAASAQQRSTPFAAALVFDALHLTGPCPITDAQFKAFQRDEHALDRLDLRACAPMPFEDGTSYTVIILNPRFRATYSVAVLSQIDRGSGVLEPRGLANVTAIDLSKLGGTPVAHGLAPAGLTLAQLTPAQVLQQLLDPSLASQLEVTILAEQRDVAEGKRTIQSESDEFQRAYASVVGPSPAPCDPIALPGDPTVHGLAACVRDVMTQLTVGNSRTWDLVTFNRTVTAIDRRIADLTLVRSRLNEVNLPALTVRLDTDATQLILRYHNYEENADIVEHALTDIREFRRLATPNASDRIGAQAVSEIRRAAIREKLKSAYAQLDEAALNMLAGDIEKAAAIWDGARFDDIERTLRSAIARAQPEQDVADVRTQLQTAVSEKNAAAAAVDALNGAFATMLAAIDDVYLQQSGRPVVAQIDTSAKAGSNRVVLCGLTSNETFHLYQFTGVTTAPAAPPAGSGDLPTVATNPAFTVAQANLSQTIDQRFTMELHKRWHANVVAGVVFSEVPAQTFGVATAASGTVVPVLVSRERPSSHYLVGLTLPFKAVDSFPGARTGGDRWMPAALFGIGIESTKQFYVGLNVEPILGIDIAAGLHYGEETILQDGNILNTTVLPAGTTTAPTGTAMHRGVFMMLGLDLDLFRRLFGTVTPG